MKKLFYSFTLALLFLSTQVQATTLGDAAAKLSAGQWVKMTSGTGVGQMGNLNATASYPAWDDSSSDNPGVNGSAAPGPAYDGGQPGWNSATRKMYFQTTEHGRAGVPNWCPDYWPIYPHGCWKPTWTYDTDTNNWDIGRTGQTITGVFPKDNSGNPLAGVHVWGGITWDDGNQVLYVKEQETSATFATRVVRFCAPTATVSYCAGQLGQWKLLPSFTFPADEVLGQALGYHRTLNGGTLLVWAQSGAGTGCAALAGYKEGTTGTNGVWTLMNSGSGCAFPTSPGAPLLEGQYSTLKQVMVLSTGTNKMWRVTNTGALQALDDAACPIGTTNGTFATAAEDQSTGEIYFLMCDGAPQIRKLNPTGAPGSQWTPIATTAQLTATGGLCEGDTACIWKIYATPIRTYGVLGFWKYKQQNIAEYWLFKPSATVSDTTPPTVSITAPTAGATVSGSAVTVSATAADNVGVVGVQFKLDGANLGVEDTASPFSITWNSTGATNGSHTITATARDAAGNSTTSTGVSVTVSNAGGSNFATRCNAPGVRFCNGFDTASDLGGDGWGSARGYGPSDSIHSTCGPNPNLCPTIDTTDKVSGAGSLKFTIPPGQTGGAAGAYWANPAADFSIRYGANQTYYVQFRQKITASYFPTILVDNGKIHWVSARPDLPGCNTSNTTNCFSSCSENEFVNQNLYGVASTSLPRWYNGCPGNNDFQFIEPVAVGQYKLQNARTGLGCTYDNVNAGNRFPPTGNCFPYYPDQWVTYSYKIALGSLGTGTGTGRCYDQSNPGSITPNLPYCYYNSQILIRMGLDGQPLEDVVLWTLPVIAKDRFDGSLTELKYGKVYFSPYTGSATVASGAAMWFDELIISDLPIADPGAPADTTNPTVAITSPIPPTTSTTTSPITVSGTAADNIGVTSVTWTCIQCVTKGGTATSSPGTSISWLIPALDLVAGTNILNVVAHDAAGNVSTAASLTITYTPVPTRYVDANLGANCTGNYSIANRTCTGTDGDAYTTANIGTAVGATLAGQTLFFRGGTYSARIDTSTMTVNSGTSGSLTNFKAYPGETVTFTSTGGNGLINIAFAAGKSFINFDGGAKYGFIFNGSDVSGGNANIFYGCSNCIITNFRSTANQANNLGGTMSSGIQTAFGASGVTVSHCRLDNNGRKSGAVSPEAPYGIYIGSASTTVDDCEIDHNGGYGIHSYHGTGSGLDNINLKNNYLHDNCSLFGETCSDIIVADGINYHVFNNVLVGSPGGVTEAMGGIQINSTTTKPLIYSNTVFFHRSWGIENLSSSADIKNNIIYQSARSGNGSSDIGESGSAGSTYATNVCGDASTKCSLKNTNPLFINVALGNFRLQSNSLALNAGTVLGSPYDIDIANISRPQGTGYDLGAYESLAVAVPPVVTIVNPTSNPTLGVSSPIFSLGGTSNLP